MSTQQNVGMIFCVLILILLAACRKDEMPPNSNTTPPQDSTQNSTIIPNPNLAGDFYTYRERRGGVSDPFTSNYTSWNDTADVTISCTLNGDTLEVLGFKLVVDSSDQIVFSYADGTGTIGGTSINVRYANNYDSIYIEYKTPCSSYGNCSVVNYIGTKGNVVNMPASGTIYTLQVNERKVRFSPPNSFNTVIDTQYTRDISIDYQLFLPPTLAPDLRIFRFHLDSTFFDLRGFESYYQHKKESLDEMIYQNVYWKNDSFYLEQKWLDYANSRSYPADTTYYLYQGRVR